MNHSIQLKTFFRRLTGIGFLPVISFAVVIGGSGCKNDELPGSEVSTPTAAAQAAESTVTNPATPVTPQPRGNPQPTLPILKLWVGTNEVRTEIASTLDQIRTGMMWRTNMAEMDGMLFVFTQPHQVAFFMKNTLLPLTCAYIDADGNILEIYDMRPLDETPIPSRSHQIQYVLEMNQGWFQRHHISPGVAIATERGTFPQTFRRR